MIDRGETGGRARTIRQLWVGPSMVSRRAIRAGWVVGLVVAYWAQASEARNVSYAFLVGVSDYQRGELKPLRYTRNDIVDFSDELQKTGFKKENIVLMHEGQRDPSR